jgi:hypothetical protein
MAACDSEFGSDGGGSGTDSRLNGTWVGPADILTFNNGNFEDTYQIPVMRGTYTTTASSITITITHYYGDILTSDTIKFSSRWYSRADLIALGVPEYRLADMFSPVTLTYSISGNTLYLTNYDGNTLTYTRK